MHNKLPKFFQDLATNPALAAQFADVAQREQVILAAGLNAEERDLLRQRNADALHNLMAMQRDGRVQDWTQMQTNNNDTNDVSRFKRRSQLSA